MNGPTSPDPVAASDAGRAEPSGGSSTRPGGTHRVLVALGSNVEPERYLPLAAQRLAQRFPHIAASRLYATEPVGAPGAPSFYNAAVAIDTELSLAELKHRVLRPLEADLGRVRGPNPNAPRTIDLDIVFCGSLVLTDPVAGLSVPDPEILTRAHLALPLADLEPQAQHPLDGRTLEQIARAFTAEPGVEAIGGPEALVP